MNLSIFVGREDSAEPTWGQYFANASLFVPPKWIILQIQN